MRLDTPEVQPTGDVGAVCWKLMTGIVVGAGIVIKWLAGRESDARKEINALHEARLQDRKDFEAQTNVLINSVLKRKGGQSP